MSEYIDVSSRLPDESGQYVVIRRGHVDIRIAHYHLDSKSWKLQGIQTNKVTHWFKCPPYPKDIYINFLLKKAMDIGLDEEEKIKLSDLLREK